MEKAEIIPNSCPFLLPNINLLFVIWNHAQEKIQSSQRLLALGKSFHYLQTLFLGNSLSVFSNITGCGGTSSGGPGRVKHVTSFIYLEPWVILGTLRLIVLLRMLQMLLGEPLSHRKLWSWKCNTSATSPTRMHMPWALLHALSRGPILSLSYKATAFQSAECTGGDVFCVRMPRTGGDGDNTPESWRMVWSRCSRGRCRASAVWQRWAQCAFCTQRPWNERCLVQGGTQVGSHSIRLEGQQANFWATWPLRSQGTGAQKGPCLVRVLPVLS